MNRHLIDIDLLPPGVAEFLVRRAQELAHGATPEHCDGEVALLFWEPSTRTRVSFELAARRVGLHPVVIDPSRSSSVKGESVEDTVATLAAMEIDALVVRHADAGTAARIAALPMARSVAVINAGDGANAHPSQALLDAATLADDGVDFADLRIVFFGDLRHSRVARSAMALYRRLGVRELRMAGPREMMPDEADPAFEGVVRFGDLDEALAGVDAVNCLRIQRERIVDLDVSDASDYHALWGLTEERAARLPRDVRILHPGPVNRGIELAHSLVDDPRSLILRQVRMGVYLRMAVFEWLQCGRPTSQQA
jgi:aspartate carbamoyltransferase catalytic subunit